MPQFVATLASVVGYDATLLASAAPVATHQRLSNRSWNPATRSPHGCSLGSRIVVARPRRERLGRRCPHPRRRRRGRLGAGNAVVASPFGTPRARTPRSGDGRRRRWVLT